MAKIRCHTIPQFYLNYFLTPGSSLFWVYDKKILKSRPQAPINTAVIGDYYTSSSDEEGKQDTQMELFLATIEGMAKPILDSWRTNPLNMNEEGKEIIAIFLSFMHSRVPRAVEIMKEMNMISLEGVIEEMKKLQKYPLKLKKHYEKFIKSEEDRNLNVSLEQFEQFIENPHKFGKISVNEKYAMGESFGMVQPIYAYLMNMTWSICAVRNKRFFVIGDAPLIVFAQTDKQHAIFGAGFGLPNVEIAFPLSPKLCLWLDKRKGPKYKIVGTDFVEEVNRRSIYMAERFVISPYKSNRLQKVVKEFSVHSGKPKIDINAITKLFAQVNA